MANDKQIYLSINQWNIDKSQVYVYCSNSSCKQKERCQNTECVRHVINSDKDEDSYMRSKRELMCIFK